MMRVLGYEPAAQSNGGFPTGYLVTAGTAKGGTLMYSLTENGTYRIDRNGQDYNELVIKDGKAYILQANCGNQVCVHSNAISYQGETITCLPHKIQITIEGGKKSEYDAVTN